MFSIRTSNDSSRKNSPSLAPPDFTLKAAWGIPASWMAEERREREASFAFAAACTRAVFCRVSRCARSSSGFTRRTSARSFSAAAAARALDLRPEIAGRTTNVSAKMHAATAPPITRTRFSRSRSNGVPLPLHQDGEADRAPLGAPGGFLDAHGIPGPERPGERGPVRLDQPGFRRLPPEAQAGSFDR